MRFIKKMMKNKIVNIIFNDLTIFGSVVFQGFLFALFFVLGEFFLALQLFISIIVVYLVALSIRYFYHKDRPNKESYKTLLEKLDASSFPSMHSMRAAILLIIIPYYYQSILVFILFAVLAIIIWFSRYIIKKHYFIDILAGIILGLIIGFLLLI